MKTKILLAVGLTAALLLKFDSMDAVAQPVYLTTNSAGNGTTPAGVILPAIPGAQSRLVSINWQSDSNTAVLSFSSGVNQYTLQATNTSSGLTQVVNSVVGVVTGSVVVLQHAGVCYASTVTSTNNGTNMVLLTGAWGVAPSIGDNVYQMSTASTVPVGATTNWANGEALYVANRGRPLRLQLTPALTTNRLPSITWRTDL